MPSLGKVKKCESTAFHNNSTYNRPMLKRVLATALLAAAAVGQEQTAQGTRPAATLVASFDGMGVGFNGPQGPAVGRNPSDNSLAVSPDRVVEIVNSRMAIYDKHGKVLYGAAPTNTIFKGFGGRCEASSNGDAVVRYDQLAKR